MKHCPKCGRQYETDLSFCLEDGTTLSNGVSLQRDVPITAALDSTTIPGNKFVKASKRSVLLPLIVLVTLLLGMFAVVAAGLIGYYYVFRTHETNSASANQTSPPRAANTAAPTPVMSPERTSPTPSPGWSPGRPSPAPAKTDGKDNDSSPPFPTPTPHDQNVPKQISGGVLNGKAVYLPKPPYPPAARAVRASGSVIVQVLVDESGNVVSSGAVTGHPLLRAAAVAAAREAKFSPTLIAGRPVKVSGVITYNFQP